MREELVVLATLPAASDLFLTFPKLQRQNIARVEIIDLYIPESPDTFLKETNIAGGFCGQQVIDAVDLTHADSDLPVVAFYTDGNTTGRYDVYIAGHGGVVATGRLDCLFRNLTNARSIDLALLDTSSVTNMRHMFSSTSSLTSLDLSGFDTSNVTNMGGMFQETSSLKTLDVSGFDTSSVTLMHAMFFNANSLTSLDLSGWDTSSVTRMDSMFCSASLKTLNFRRATFTNAINRTDMFTDSGIDTITVGSTAAQSFIQTAPGWSRTPPRKIVVEP